MKTLLKKLPMPMVGTMLGFAAAGNLIQSYGEVYRNILGGIAGVIFILLTIKFISDFDGLKNDLNTPIGASVFPTYSMTIMLFATYINPFNKTVAYVVWIIGIVLHLALVIFFTNKYVRAFKIKQVFPSWFIVYVGIAVAAVTSKAFHPTIGQIAFWLGFVCYIILLFVVGKRVFVVKEIPEPAMPTLMILAAPGSLCLAGYINAFEAKNMALFWVLLILGQGIYLYALTRLPGLLRLKFYPSYSSFTFPLVISALSLKLSNGFLTAGGMNTGILPVIVKVEELIGIVMIFYVLVRYLLFIGKNIMDSNEVKRMETN